MADRVTFTTWLQSLRATDWVVYAKPPFAGPEQVLEYLGRYTHRIAVSNNRLVSLLDGVVRFHWKDYADHDRVKVMALDVEEFLRRFVLHVLPSGLMRAAAHRGRWPDDDGRSRNTGSRIYRLAVGTKG